MVLAFPQEGDLVASWVALLSFTPQWGTQPQAPQPQTDSAAGAGPTLDISFTGLGLHDGFHQSCLLDASLPSEHLLALCVSLNGVSFL